MCVVFSHKIVTLELSEFQRTELLLTIAQSLLTVLLLSDLKIRSTEAIGFFLLWLVQLFIPVHYKTVVLVGYFVWIFFEAARLIYTKDQLIAWRTLVKVIRHKKIRR